MPAKKKQSSEAAVREFVAYYKWESQYFTSLCA